MAGTIRNALLESQWGEPKPIAFPNSLVRRRLHIRA